ncbi:sensor histidine kinase [Aquiflexum sp.]|uniref:sensor histidine kinase n=1 Tax=Aquiflexum sp. TaxID=1872584 RepID=UPI0035937CC8
MATVLIWIVAMTYLINSYGFEWSLALLDVTVHSVVLLLGFVLLENIFRFYIPQKSQWWLVVVLPVIFVLIGVMLSEYLLKFLISNQYEYLEFVRYVLPIKGTFLFVMFLFWSILLVFNGQIEDQIKSKERQEKVQEMAKEAELYHLKQQLKPHFLFNSLNSINALIKSQPEKAREMVLNLAEFLRGTIKKDDQKWVSISEEKEYLNLFLDIEKIRFGHRLKVDIQVESDSLDMKIPQLLVQPLLENAIKHGLYGMTGNVFITMNFFKDGQYLKITITNPFDPESAPTKGAGFGLEVVKRRLYLLFGRNDLLATELSGNIFIVDLKIPQLYGEGIDHR